MLVVLRVAALGCVFLKKMDLFGKPIGSTREEEEEERRVWGIWAVEVAQVLELGAFGRAAISVWCMYVCTQGVFSLQIKICSLRFEFWRSEEKRERKRKREREGGSEVWGRKEEEMWSINRVVGGREVKRRSVRLWGRVQSTSDILREDHVWCWIGGKGNWVLSIDIRERVQSQLLFSQTKRKILKTS